MNTTTSCAAQNFPLIPGVPDRLPLTQMSQNAPLHHLCLKDCPLRLGFVAECPLVPGVYITVPHIPGIPNRVPLTHFSQSECPLIPGVSVRVTTCTMYPQQSDQVLQCLCHSPSLYQMYATEWPLTLGAPSDCCTQGCETGKLLGHNHRTIKCFVEIVNNLKRKQVEK